ncbi:MAG: FtsX-like permease family protein [Saprospiraceae bacterium]|nr:ABC transporter permease [Lewinella sp.]
MNVLSLSWKNLINKPLSMLLSLILFALGVGLVSLIMLLNKQVDQQFSRNLEGVDMVIGAKGSPLQLVLSSIYHLDAPTGNISIADAKAFLRPGHPLIAKAIPLSLGDSYQGFRIVGTTPDIIAHYRDSLAAGELWHHPLEVVIGSRVADKEGLRIGNEFFSTHGLDINEDLEHDDAGAFKVVGILEKSGSVIDQLILTAPESIWEVHEHQATPSTDEGETHTEETDGEHEEESHIHEAAGMDTIPLYEKTDKDITSILVQFNGRNARTLNLPRMINENTNLMAANPSYEISKLFDQLGLGEQVLRWLGYIIIGVSFLSIFIALFNSLRERKYELAIMRTLGASQDKLFLLIIFEGLLLAVLGYIVGMLASHIGLSIIGEVVESADRYAFTGWTFLKEEIWLLVGALGVGLLAAIIPAWQARQTDIHETLAEG